MRADFIFLTSLTPNRVHVWLLCCVCVAAGGDRPFLVSGADDRMIKVTGP